MGSYFYHSIREIFKQYDLIKLHIRKKEGKPSSTCLFTWERIVSPPNLTRDACSCSGNRNSKPKRLESFTRD